MTTTYPKALVPVDLSKGSLAVLQEAVGLAAFGVRQVVALHLYDVSGVESPVVRAMDAEAQQAVDAAVATIETPGAVHVVTGEARCGIDADCVLKTAEELEANLIVLGSTGKRPVHELLYGSLSEQVAREAAVPVLFIRFPTVIDQTPAQLLDMAGHISDVVMHPTDFSECSGRALDAALDTEPERLILSHVVDDTTRPKGSAEPLVEEATRRLKTIRRRIRRSGTQIDIRVGAGDPAPALLRLAADESVTMIALGSRGRGLMTETILGGVSMDIMRAARVPVLVVR